MNIKPIKTRAVMPPKDDLFALIKESFSKSPPNERSIIVFASKIVAIGQGRTVKITDISSKDALIQKEAELYLPRDNVPEGYVMLTMKNGIMIPTAGIDESNAGDYYILWPEKPYEAAKDLHAFVKKEYGLKKLGVIISDSHTVPLRWGTMGIALSYWGFYPLYDYRGTQDVFGREMKISQLNIADSLATAANMAMGEGSEQTPIAIIENLAPQKILFGSFDFAKENPLAIKREEDIYGPLLNTIEWEKGGH